MQLRDNEYFKHHSKISDSLQYYLCIAANNEPGFPVFIPALFFNTIINANLLLSIELKKLTSISEKFLSLARLYDLLEKTYLIVILPPSYPFIFESFQLVDFELMINIYFNFIYIY